jgi:multidrug efflux system membrane fusion protein
MDVDRSRADRDMAIAAVAHAKANLDDAELSLSYTRVVSPIEGVASRNLVDAGNLVGQSGPTLLTRVNKLRPIYVYFHAPESLVLKYLAEREDVLDEDKQRKDGGEAFVARATDVGFPFVGVIDFIDNEVDRNTGTIEMRVRLENEKLDFFPGLFVRIKVLGEEMPDGILVPEVALGSDLGGKYILTVGENNIVVQKYVTLGLPQSGGLIHIREGLTGDETIIVNGLMFARPGMPVTPLTAEQFAAMQKQAAAGN